MQQITELRTLLKEKDEKTGKETAETSDNNPPPLNDDLQKTNTPITEQDTNESQK